MAGYKETPRQKMIGMMYLVLTALLALNVSKDILDAFVVVNESLVITNENFEKKINLSYEKFKQQNDLAPAKVGPYYQKALLAKKYSDELTAYIEGLRNEVIAKTEGISIDEATKLTLRQVSRKDNYDIGTQYFIGDSPDGSIGKARELKLKIEKYKADMKALVDPKYQSTLKLGLNTEDVNNEIEGKVNWEMKNFHHLVLAGVVTNLNKTITEVRNAEFDVTNTLYSAISAEDFKFDMVTAKVVAKSSYIMNGSEYEADIFVAAYDSKVTHEVVVGADVDTVNYRIIGDSTKVEGVDGLCKYKLNASGVGEKKYAGIIKITSGTGEIKKYWFRSSYIVGQPSATVSADKMNVFYIGIPNPVTVSVPGVPNDKVRASISTGGTFKAKGAGKYDVNVTAAPGAKIIINVMADMAGRQTSMGTATFRVKRVPDPVPTIGNSTGGIISKQVLAAAGGIIPVMKDFDFEGVNFTITSFTFSMVIRGDYIEKQGVGNRLTTEMTTMIKSAVTGTKVFFENIKAKGPDGANRGLSPINLKLSN